MCKIQFYILDRYEFYMQIEWSEKWRNSISCLSPVVSNAGIAPSFYFCPLFLRAPCRRRLDRDSVRIPCPESDETGHFLYSFFMEIVFDIVLIRVDAGKFSSGISQGAESTAIVAFRAFYGLFFGFH
jgi:hypothetical protein